MDDPRERIDMANRTCSLPGCDRMHRARGLCASHYNQQHQPDRHRKTEVPCTICGAMVLKDIGRTGRYRVVCSYRCRYIVTHGRTPESRKQLVPVVKSRPESVPIAVGPTDGRPRFFSHECKGCGCRFLTDRMAFSSGTDQWCSKSCIGSANRHKRRATIKGSPVVERGLSWRAALRTNGPACHLCGFDVNPADFTTAIGADGREVFIAGPEYPSLDHIEALARGGEHSRANAALAHMLCNSIKNDLPMSEVA